MKSSRDWRRFVLILGLIAAGLSCYGNWEYAFNLEGRISYLVLAAPLVAVSAAIIPPYVEWTWANGQYVKSVLWFLALGPAAATVFFSSAEMVHNAKAHAEAGRVAMHNAAERAKTELTEAKAEHAEATKAWNSLKEAKQQGPKYRTAKATYETASQRLEEAEKGLILAESKSTADAPIKGPVWLLPAALDILAFMAIWTGLSVPRPRAPPVKVKRKARKARPKKTTTSKPTLEVVNG
jgi:hypothetical protein